MVSREVASGVFQISSFFIFISLFFFLWIFKGAVAAERPQRSG